MSDFHALRRYRPTRRTSDRRRLS